MWLALYTWWWNLLVWFFFGFWYPFYSIHKKVYVIFVCLFVFWAFICYLNLYFVLVIDFGICVGHTTTKCSHPMHFGYLVKCVVILSKEKCLRFCVFLVFVFFGSSFYQQKCNLKIKWTQIGWLVDWFRFNLFIVLFSEVTNEWTIYLRETDGRWSIVCCVCVFLFYLVFVSRGNKQGNYERIVWMKWHEQWKLIEQTKLLQLDMWMGVQVSALEYPYKLAGGVSL